jgi:hypothetical protein
MGGNYKITTEDKRRYASLILLNEMINLQRYWNVSLEGDDKYLHDIFIQMLSDEWIKIEEEKNIYIPTKKGRDTLVNTYQRLREYLTIYDVYSAVDVETGDFAFSEYWNKTQNEFEEYLNDKRWMDLRIAVCEFKKINPIEIVFLSFLNDNVFDVEKDSWQFDLYSDLIWDEIIEICNTAYSMEEFGGNDAMEDLVTQGNEVMNILHEKEKEMDEQDEEYDEESYCEDIDEEEEYVTYVETVEVVIKDVYYDNYYRDPFYVSPVWLMPLFIL